jgi:hypothetical protein
MDCSDTPTLRAAGSIEQGGGKRRAGVRPTLKCLRMPARRNCLSDEWRKRGAR